MKILIIGDLYSANLGDGIICENVKEIIKKENSEQKLQIKLVDIYCKNGYIKDDKSQVNAKRNNISDFIRSIIYKSEFITYKIQDIKTKKRIKKICEEHYDLAIFAGGHLFIPYFTFQIYNFVKYLSKNNVKIIFNGCGVGKIKSPILIHKIRKTLRNKNILYVSSRDNIDMLKQKYMCKSNIEVRKTYDPAIFTRDTYGITKNENSKIIGLGVMKIGNISEDTLIEFWKGIIEELNRKGYKWQIFCNGNKDDYILSCKVLKKLDMPIEEKYIAERPTLPKQLVETISRYHCLISCRLHSHIVAYSLDIPTIAIVWDEKIKFFFKNLSLENRYFELEAKNISKIIDKLVEIEDTHYDMQEMEKEKNVVVRNLKI